VLLDVEALKDWFKVHRRDLPWRDNPSPYAVWVSEVMLQQTLASVVVDYFHRWMQRFPTLERLAAAPLEEVIKVWEGLGYYSRVRHLHQAAQYLMAHHGGKIPATYETLITIPGLGPYTVGAILSFAFRQKKAAVDGNTRRVLSRYFREESDKEIRHLAEELLPDEEPWEVVEGLIELGALVCKREPVCAQCPLKRSCRAHALGVERQFPPKKERPPLTHLVRSVFLLLHEGDLLVKKGVAGSVMADLYEFPFVEEGESFLLPQGAWQLAEFPPVLHHFTRFKVRLNPTLWKIEEKKHYQGYAWRPFKELLGLPFSAGHLQILRQYEHFTH
jgi:A/G-specific adenine glycosylase